MKIRLTEGQYDMIRLLKEETNFISQYTTKMDSLKEKVNNLYSKLTFSTLSEFIDGDVDTSVIKQELERLENINDTYRRKLNDFFNLHMSEKEYHDKWEGKDVQLENLSFKIDHKISAIEQILNSMEPLSNSNINEKFSDIKTKEI